MSQENVHDFMAGAVWCSAVIWPRVGATLPRGTGERDRHIPAQKEYAGLRPPKALFPSLPSSTKAVTLREG
jgi:hypothetical protein